MDPHTRFMHRAIHLAYHGVGLTSPNPPVGAVLVKRGKIIGQGFHHGPGLPHAEREALNSCKTSPRGASLYVTLEPCCHAKKRTPPCTGAIASSGIREVFVATKDPNPLVNGQGIAQLGESGIPVHLGLFGREAERLIEAHAKWITTRRPFVTFKAVMSEDQKIAIKNSVRRLIISGPESRRFVHALRSKVDAVMVGIGTVLKDDPLLTARGPGVHRQPLKVIVDSSLRIPEDARLFREGKALIVTTKQARRMRQKLRLLQRKKNVEILVLPEKKGKADLRQLMRRLGQRQITSVLLEGGSRLNEAMLQERLVDKLLLFTAPLAIGKNGVPVAGGIDPFDGRLFTLQQKTVRKLGRDVLVEGYPAYR